MMRRPISECHQPWESMIVDPLGGVQPCCFASRQVGNLTENMVEEIWNGPRMIRLRGAIRDGFIDAVCRNASCPFVRETERLHGIESYDFRCDLNVLVPTTEIGRTSFCVSGWSVPEYWGVWTSDRDARLILDLPDTQATSLGLEFHCRGAGHVHLPDMKVRVAANGRELDSWNFAYPEETEKAVLRTVEISTGLIERSRLDIRFRIDDPVCPQSWGVNDGRQIGLGLSAIRVLARAETRHEPDSRPPSSSRAPA